MNRDTKEWIVTTLRRLIPRTMSVRSLLRHDSFLRITGWLESFRLRQAVDSKGQPIPWMTY